MDALGATTPGACIWYATEGWENDGENSFVNLDPGEAGKGLTFAQYIECIDDTPINIYKGWEYEKDYAAVQLSTYTFDVTAWMGSIAGGPDTTSPCAGSNTSVQLMGDEDVNVPVLNGYIANNMLVRCWYGVFEVGIPAGQYLTDIQVSNCDNEGIDVDLGVAPGKRAHRHQGPPMSVVHLAGLYGLSREAWGGCITRSRCRGRIGFPWPLLGRCGSMARPNERGTLVIAKEVVERWFELYSDGTPDSYGSHRFMDLYAPTLTWTQKPTKFAPVELRGGIGELRELLARTETMFRNRRVEADLLVAEDPHVVAFYKWSGTVAADVEGFSLPAGSHFTVDMISLFTVEEDLISSFTDWGLT